MFLVVSFMIILYFGVHSSMYVLYSAFTHTLLANIYKALGDATVPTYFSPYTHLAVLNYTVLIILITLTS